MQSPLSIQIIRGWLMDSQLNLFQTIHLVELFATIPSNPTITRISSDSNHIHFEWKLPGRYFIYVNIFRSHISWGYTDELYDMVIESKDAEKFDFDEILSHFPIIHNPKST